MHSQPTPKLIGHCFCVLETLAKQTKIDLDKAVDQVLHNKGVKIPEFWRELEIASQTTNELRFYHDLLVPQNSSKPLQVVLASRKQILTTKQVTNYPGLAMDKVFLALDEWSAVVTRLFACHAQPGQSLLKFQSALDHLCKSHATLKPVKENIGRVTLTTLLECVYLTACTVDRSLDHTGKHIVEQSLVDRPSAGHATNLGMLGPANNHTKSGLNQTGTSKTGVATTPLKLATAYVARVESPQSKLKDLVAEPPKTDYTAYHKLLQRKADLAAELKAVEAQHAQETNRTITGLAEVLAVSKVQKNADNDFLLVSKEYLTFMRRKISGSGRKSVSSNDFQNFQQLAELQSKMTSVKKEQEISLRLSEELGENFRKLMRNNFSSLKKAEQEFLKKMFEAKERANLKAKGQNNQYSAGYEEEEEDDEDKTVSEKLAKSRVANRRRSESQANEASEAIGEEELGEAEEVEGNYPGDLVMDVYEHAKNTWESMEHLPEPAEFELEPVASEKRAHRFSDIDHPDCLLESQMEDERVARKKINFEENSDDQVLKGEDNVWGSAAGFNKEDEDDSLVYEANKNDLWESAAVEGDHVDQLPDSIMLGQGPRKRMATEPPLKTIMAESLVHGDRMSLTSIARGSSSSDVFNTDRESIVKRLPIPKLDTGSEEEIKMTDEADV